MFQQFLNLPSSQRDMSGPILGALFNNRWSGGIYKLVVANRHKNQIRPFPIVAVWRVSSFINVQVICWINYLYYLQAAGTLTSIFPPHGCLLRRRGSVESGFCDESSSEAGGFGSGSCCEFYFDRPVGQLNPNRLALFLVSSSEDDLSSIGGESSCASTASCDSATVTSSLPSISSLSSPSTASTSSSAYSSSCASASPSRKSHSTPASTGSGGRCWVLDRSLRTRDFVTQDKEVRRIVEYFERLLARSHGVPTGSLGRQRKIQVSFLWL